MSLPTRSDKLSIPIRNVFTHEVLMSPPPKAARCSALSAPKARMGQRLGWKKANSTTTTGQPLIRVTDLSETVEASATRGQLARRMGIPLIPLSVAQQRRDISHRGLVLEEEGVGRPCGSYSIGCDLLPLDIARGRKEVSHRMFLY